ncbi:MAG: glycosyltransferase family 2 protein [Lachnospiraceae bacterium]|nr:glycosyltransferase family 2 protein [Lachnospiraceae bacterium]
MYLSVIIPCYNEESVLAITHQALHDVLGKDAKEHNYDYQLIFINDGSRDNTLSILKELCENDPCSHYISFSRNFGKESAMLAGLEYSSGECVVIMDADMQHPPKLIPTLISYYEEGYDQVVTKRNRTGDAKRKTALAKLYYKIVNSLIDVKLDDGIGDFRLLSRNAASALLSLTEYNRFSKGLFSWIGFRTKVVEMENSERAAGETKWSVRSLLHYGIEGIISFNNKPLRICFYVGTVLILFSLAYILYLLVSYLFYGVDTPGYFTTITAVLLIGGTQLFCIGVLGEYIGRIYYEVKRRPHYIIDDTNMDMKPYRHS